MSVDVYLFQICLLLCESSGIFCSFRCPRIQFPCPALLSLTGLLCSSQLHCGAFMLHPALFAILSSQRQHALLCPLLPCSLLLLLFSSTPHYFTTFVSAQLLCLSSAIVRTPVLQFHNRLSCVLLI